MYYKLAILGSENDETISLRAKKRCQMLVPVKKSGRK